MRSVILENYVPQPRVLTIQGRSDPMQNRTPEIYPADELKVVGGVGLTFYDVEDRLVQDCNGASDPCNAERLRSEDGEDEGGHEGG